MRTKTEAEYAIDIKTILEIYEVKASEIEGTDDAEEDDEDDNGVIFED